MLLLPSGRPLTLFTAQFGDIPLAELAAKAAAWGYNGLELACGSHFDVYAASGPDGEAYCTSIHEILAAHELDCWAISNHCTGQAVCDQIDERHKEILSTHVWGDGNPEGVRQRAAEEMKKTAIAAKNMGVSVVNGFTGSSIWHLLYSFPPVPPERIDDGYYDFGKCWKPILDVFGENEVRFALEVHPTEIAFDTYSAEVALEAINHHPQFGFNYDPSHLAYQGVDYIQFIHKFTHLIFHVHMKDVQWGMGDGTVGVFGGHSRFGDHRRNWDFRSLGHGLVNFDQIIVALNEIEYVGPLSVEWEDPFMDRDHGAAEAAEVVCSVDFPPAKAAFDAAFAKQ